MDPVTELLVVSAMAVMAGLLVMTLIIGAAVAIRPALLDRLRARADQRVSMRRATRVLDRPRNIDHILYRYHRAYGAVVVVLSIGLLYFLVFGEARGGWHKILGINNDIVADILRTSAQIVLWIASVFALMIGTVVFVRPSALKGFERWANRWLTTRRLTRDLDREYYIIERGVHKHPRALGSLVAGVSLFCLVALYVQWRLSGLAV